MTSESADKSPMIEKCTPGDWDYIGDHVVGVTGDCNCPTKPPEGDFVAYPLTAHAAHDVVKPVFEDELPEGVTMEEHMANCKLIAASKALFKACAAFEVFDNHASNCANCDEWGPGNCNEGAKIFNEAHRLNRAAMAKAKGENA